MSAAAMRIAWQVSLLHASPRRSEMSINLVMGLVYERDF